MAFSEPGNSLRMYLLAPAVTALLGMGAVSTAIYLYGSPPATPPRTPPNTLAPAPPAPSAFGWRLTSAMSAERALVLEVETTRPGEAVAIAQQLTEPYKDRFDEVLVYFFPPHATPRRAILRVQWTRAGGYRTLTLRTSQ